MTKASRNAFVIVAAGLWSAAWSALPYAIYHRLDEPIRSQMLETASILGLVLGKWLGLTATPGQALQVAGIFLAVATLAAIWLATLSWLDRRVDSARLVRWGLQTAPMLAVWLFGIVASVTITRGMSSNLAVVSWLINIVSFIALPAFCWRAEIVDAASPPRFWGGAWPGLSALGFAALMATLYFMISAALDLLPRAVSGSDLIMALTDLSITTILFAAAAAPWLQRAHGSAVLTAAARAMHPATLRAVLAVQLRIQGFLLLALAPPILVITADVIYFMPEAEAAFSRAGRESPALLARWAAFEHWVDWVWSIPIAAILSWMTMICVARALRQSAPDTASPI
ncbi:putative membrane protein [Lysobacter antibioticus]|uniref:hypothetical protein n=1 Tax=Lysobacter antibioticus TaxID=84531 RepID=UPI0007172173|nr:hypothetical protein [Lysobacter antibioticus]ALN64890.1 putative membrane protein [Lysobacter antibioticus]